MDSQSKISWQLIHPHCWKMLGGYYNKMFTASSLSSLQLILRIYQKKLLFSWNRRSSPNYGNVNGSLHLAELSQWLSFPGHWGENLFYCSTLSTAEPDPDCQRSRQWSAYQSLWVCQTRRPDSTCVNISPPVSCLLPPSQSLLEIIFCFSPRRPVLTRSSASTELLSVIQLGEVKCVPVWSLSWAELSNPAPHHHRLHHH